MRKGDRVDQILIASHGSLASGFKSALEIIYGDLSRVTFMDAYIEGVNFNQEFEEWFDQQNKNDHLILISDLYGGSVNNEFMKKSVHHNVTVITGANLMIILGILSCQAELTEERLEVIIQEALALTGIVHLQNQNEKDDFY